MADPDLEHICALLPEGALRLYPDPEPKPFYSIYKRVRAGLYEAARTYPGGRMFGFLAHHNRMVAGCDAIGIHASLMREQLAMGLQQAIDEHPCDELKVRWDLAGLPYEELDTHARMIVTLTPLEALPDWVLQEGVDVLSTSELQRTNPHTKGSAFAIERQRIAYGGRKNYEPLLVSEDGRILEGAQSNFACFIEGRLRLSLRQALPGITIQTLERLALELGHEVLHEPIPIAALPSMQEAFLCSSVRGVIPIRSIDGQVIGDNQHCAPGPQVTALTQRYLKHAEELSARLVR